MILSITTRLENIIISLYKKSQPKQSNKKKSQKPEKKTKPAKIKSNPKQTKNINRVNRDWKSEHQEKLE